MPRLLAWIPVDILGVSAFYHDSAACLVRDGEVVAAAEEERFSRVKHDSRFPRAAIDYCLRAGGRQVSELDLVVFYEKPLIKFQRLVATYLEHAPRGYHQYRRSAALWAGQRLRVRRGLDREFAHGFRGRYGFTRHHQAHAASAFYPSPFEDAAILTLDAVGEWATTSIAHGRGHRTEMLQELRFPHSLGLLYSAVTGFAGFRVNSAEYKLMGLAPYGDPVYRELILDRLIDLRPDGSFALNMKYFAFSRSDVMTTARFDRLFGGPARDPNAPITRREMDLAASVQAVTDEVVLRAARRARELTGSSNLVLAGGVALNGVANGRLLQEGVFKRIWVPSAPGDSGGAVGCALFAWHHVLGHPKTPTPTDRMRGGFLGPAYDGDEIRDYLTSVGAAYHPAANEQDLCDTVARWLNAGKVVAHFAGRMEFGPRALGHRSILADARDPDMKRTLNLRVKSRESFRPFAPAVLREQVHHYFACPEGFDSPYMAFVTDVQPSAGSAVPAVTHVDGSARLQTVDGDRNPRLHGILRSFQRLTGCPLIINTSLNVQGEPIVRTPAEAYHCLMSTGIDVLVLEDVVVVKDEQPAGDEWPSRVGAD